MRARALLLSLLLLNLGAVASADRALARSPRGMRTADAAAPMRTFYMKGTLLSPSGTPSLLAGLAKLSVGSTGAYSGTLTMAGVAATSVVVTGTISGTMTLIAQLGGQSITLAARSVAAPVGDRGKSSPDRLPAIGASRVPPPPAAWISRAPSRRAV